MSSKTNTRELTGGVTGKWGLAATKSLKDGPRRTMYLVSRTRRTGAAVCVDVYTHTGTYAGEWRADMKHGFGTHTYANGDKYEGHWRNDKPEGRGTLYKFIPSARSEASRHRPGASPSTSRHRNGRLVKVFDGDFVRGQRHGLGRSWYGDGEVYEGGFAEDKRSGMGTHRYVDGSSYSGEWLNDKRHGKGTLTLRNGDSYTGHWADDKKNGAGRFVSATRGRVYVGEWVDDVPKCGEMMDISAADMSAGAYHPGLPGGTLLASGALPGEDGSSAPTLLPALTLAAPTAVISEALQDARGSGPSAAEIQPALFDQQSSVISPGQSALYNIDGASVELSQEEVEQLAAAFRQGDPDGTGRVPADVDVLRTILAPLGIEATLEDAQGLLRELIAQEADNAEALADAAGEEAGEAATSGEWVSFPTFAACMARLRE